MVFNVRSDGLQLQVGDVVVFLVTVDVMDVVVRWNTAIMLFPDDPVFIFAPEFSSFGVRPDALDVASAGLDCLVVRGVHRWLILQDATRSLRRGGIRESVMGPGDVQRDRVWVSV